MSDAFKKTMLIKTKIGNFFKLCSAVVSCAILTYEVLSGLHWLATRQFFHYKTCHFIGLLTQSDTCSVGFTGSTVDINKFMNIILQADIFYSALILIGIFALIGACFIPRER